MPKRRSSTGLKSTKKTEICQHCKHKAHKFRGCEHESWTSPNSPAEPCCCRFGARRKKSEATEPARVGQTPKATQKPVITDDLKFSVVDEAPEVATPTVTVQGTVSVHIPPAHYYERVLTLRAGNILDLIEAKHRAYESCARYLDVVRVTSASLISFCRPPHVANPMTGDCFAGAESMWELATYFTRESHQSNQVIEDELPAFVACWREAFQVLKATDSVALWGTMSFAVEHTPNHQAIYWTEFKRRLRSHGVDLDARTIKAPQS